jgi:sugar phosphate isomerase/epimerase
MRIGVLNTVIGGADEPETFARARWAGFAGVELDLVRAELRSAECLRRYAAAARESGLAVPSLVLGEHNLGGIASADKAVAAEASRDVRDAIAWAAELGARVILVPFFSHALLCSDDDVARAAEAFSSLCEPAAANGVSLCYEGLLSAERIGALAREVSSPAFGCYADLANPLRVALDPAAELRALGALVRQVHVKDVRASDGGLAHPGQGDVDFAACAAALAEIGYDGWLVLETPTAPPPVVSRDLVFTEVAFLAGLPPRPGFGAFSYDFAAGEWALLEETFAGFGLDAVQLGGGLLDDALARPALAADSRLDVVGLAGYRNLVAPDEGVRRANVDFLGRCLEAAPALGTWVVATEAGTRNPGADWLPADDNWTPATWTLLEDAVGELLAVAERHGTILAIEPHVHHAVRTQEHLARLFETFPTEHLQAVCDPYNYLTVDLLADERRHTRDLLERFESRFVLAHLKDVDVEDGATVRPAFGTGVFAQEPYLEFLRTRRPDLPLILEHLPLDAIPTVKRHAEELVGA